MSLVESSAQGAISGSPPLDWVMCGLAPWHMEVEQESREFRALAPSTVEKSQDFENLFGDDM